MNTIVLFYVPNLSDIQESQLLAMSGVGIAKSIESGETVLYGRLRNITKTQLTDMGFSSWEFPARQNPEVPFEFSNGEIQTALVQLKTPAFDCIWIEESLFNILSGQLEFQES